MQWWAIALVVIAAVVLAVPLMWLRTRPMRNGTLAQAWGMPDDDEARAEIERVFPGATKPVDEE